MTERTKRLVAVGAALVLFLGAQLAIAMFTSCSSRAATVERVRETQPASCNGQRCTQLRTVTYYAHGQDTLVVTKRRTAPAESRTPTSVIPWRPWRVVGAVVLPCCGEAR
jgi:hypothetical protein